MQPAPAPRPGWETLGVTSRTDGYVASWDGSRRRDGVRWS